MPHYLKIKTDEDLKFLKLIIGNWHAKMHNNISGYVEYLDIIDSLQDSLEHPLKDLQEVMDEGEKDLLAAVDKPKPITRRKQRSRKSDIAKLPTHCDVHKTYGAQRPPRTNCEICWNAYKKLNPTRYAVAHRKFLREQNVN